MKVKLIIKTLQGRLQSETFFGTVAGSLLAPSTLQGRLQSETFFGTVAGFVLPSGACRGIFGGGGGGGSYLTKMSIGMYTACHRHSYAQIPVAIGLLER